MPTVIRAGDVPRVASRLASVDLADHLEEARALVVDARNHASRMLESARSEAARLGPQARKQGYEGGYQEGHQKGLSEGREKGLSDGYREAHSAATAKFDEQHAAIVSDITRLVDEMSARREVIELAGRQDLLDFAIALATKLTFQIGTLNREAVVENLQKAIQLVQTKTDLTIRAHPRDLAAIEEFAGSVLLHAQGAGGVHVVSDEEIAPGGCVVKNESTEVDATLGTQIEEIVALLLGDRSDGAIGNVPVGDVPVGDVTGETCDG